MTHIFNGRWVGYLVAQTIKTIIVGAFWKASEKLYYWMKRRGFI